MEGGSPGRRVPITASAAIVAIIVLAAVYLRAQRHVAGDSQLPRSPDTITAATPAPPASPATSATTSASAPATGGLAPAPAAPPPAASVPDARRYARTWANVRSDRTVSSPTVGMLNPGDQVLVDSLVRGWYRVTVEGRALGYVHRSTLAGAPPE